MLELGKDELNYHGGDLRLALVRSPDCRAEILLFWLANQIGAEGYGRDLVLMAAGIMGELNTRPAGAIIMSSYNEETA